MPTLQQEMNTQSCLVYGTRDKSPGKIALNHLYGIDLVLAGRPFEATIFQNK